MAPSPPVDSRARRLPWIPACAGMTELAGVTGTCGGDPNHLSRIGVRDMLSYQSPMPVATGTPRYENGGLGC